MGVSAETSDRGLEMCCGVTEGCANFV